MGFNQRLGLLLCATGLLAMLSSPSDNKGAVAAIASSASITGQTSAPALTISRTDFWLESDPGIEIFVREVAANSAPTGEPILLL